MFEDLTRKPVIQDCPEVQPNKGWHTADHKSKRPPVLAAQSQQMHQGAKRSKLPLEEVDLFLQGGTAAVVAEVAVMYRSLQRPHRVPGCSW